MEFRAWVWGGLHKHDTGKYTLCTGMPDPYLFSSETSVPNRLYVSGLKHGPRRPKKRYGCALRVMPCAPGAASFFESPKGSKYLKIIYLPKTCTIIPVTQNPGT